MDEDDIARGAAEMGFENWGRIAALEMMIRALFTKWALETKDPLAFVEDTHKGLIQSMADRQRLDDPVEGRLIQHAEDQLDDAFENIRRRVAQALSG